MRDSERRQILHGLLNIPDLNSPVSSADDSRFAGPKQQPTSKISVNLPQLIDCVKNLMSLILLW